MPGIALSNDAPARSGQLTFTTLVHPILRYRSAALVAFCALFGAVVVAVSLMHPVYEATMKVLVKRERMDPVMTPSADAPSQARSDVTEDELNSEVELLQGRDLAEHVALASGLVTAPAPPQGGRPASPAEIGRIVDDLHDSLKVAAIRKTNLIQLQYRNTDPVLAARVLSNLATLYVEKHLAVHRPVGAQQFFQQQSEALGHELQTAQDRLAAFGRDEQVVSPLVERDSALQSLAEFEALLRRTQAAIAEDEQRIRTLNGQLANTPNRQTTQVRTAQDGDRIRELDTRLLDLELRRAETLRKFTPEYPLVQQLGEQIAQVKAALGEAQATPVTAETTDQNPTHQWLRDERARAATERDALGARQQALVRAIDEYRTKARHLDEARLRQDGLVSAVKAAQEAHQLYLHKEEEARISDALDRAGIANVSLAEAPTIPAVPSNSGRVTLLLLGLIGAAAASLALAWLLHLLNPYFRTADEARTFLGVPVLATLPAGMR